MKENKPENEEISEETEISEIPSSPEKQENGGSLSIFIDWMEMFIVYISVGMLLLLLVFRHSPVSGSSMVPTLEDKDILIVSGTFYTPKTGDIVVCQSENYGLDTPLVKRVIATGGQTVTLDYVNWKVTVDGVTLKEDYVNFVDGVSMKKSDWLENTFTVPEGYVFVMGDNRNHSTDSRFEDVGFIDERYILGKVRFRIFPFGEPNVYKK